MPASAADLLGGLDGLIHAPAGQAGGESFAGTGEDA